MIKLNLSYLLLVMLLLNSCLETKTSDPTATNNAAKAEKEEDCDETAAKKTLESIKTEEFSLNKTNDAGCTLSEDKPIDIPANPKSP